ncbi:hypothetical protein Anae109_2617 [Anaeromyxobacter sp. Fw109-5]|nr:hypothetical protein Anae109_2617 [Anaeromyxobacter sp. Fw109-5]
MRAHRRRWAVGTRGRTGKAALCVAVLCASASAAASTVVEPIARLTLEGGYDSNALYYGSSDRTGRVSPEVGLRLRDHTWDLRTVYGADFVRYDRLQPNGSWNHRGSVSLDARATRRLTLRGTLRGAYAYDPAGLAQMGIFPEDVDGLEEVFTLRGRGRAEYRLTEHLEVAGTVAEEMVRFPQDRTGGAMHQAGVETLYRSDRRLSIGGAYVASLFQEFLVDDVTGDRTEWANAHGLRARARYQLTRHYYANAWAGPALWFKSGDGAVVPEGGIELFGASRGWEMRAVLAHGLGLGNTARPGLNDWTELGLARRFARRFELRGDSGIWRSGRTPGGEGAGSGLYWKGEDAVTGYLVAGEAALLVGGGVRIAFGAAHFARIESLSVDTGEDDPFAQPRTTFGLRLGWALPER